MVSTLGGLAQMQTNAVVRWCAFGSLLLTMAHASLAQGKSEEQSVKQPQIKVQTTLVMVPVNVTDRSGKPIGDLKVEDFQVLRDGETQKIGFFRHVLTNAKVMKPGAAPPEAITNTMESSNQRLTIFVVDLLNASFVEQRTAREQLLKFLSKSLDVKEPLALLALDQVGVRVIHDFTTDPGMLAEALKSLTEQPSAKDRPESNPVEGTFRMVHGWHSKSQSRNAAAERSRLETLAIAQNYSALAMKDRISATLEALREIGEAFTGIPGRKSMIWATGGFPLELDDLNAIGVRDRGLRDRELLPVYERAWNALNRANIAVYPLDVEDLVNPAYLDAQTGHPLPQHIQLNMSIANMEKFAEMTGGKFCDRREDAASCFQEAVNDSSDYYLLGIYTSADAKQGWRKLSVHVLRADVQVRARKGYYAGLPQEEEQQIKEEIEAAINSPFDYTAVPLGVQWSVAKEAGADGRKKIAFRFALAPGIATVEEADNNHLSLEFAAVAKDPKGLPMGAFSKAVDGHLTGPMAGDIKTKGVKFPGTFELAPGEYMMIFAVRDNLSRLIGSVSAAISVP
jgi:VWFA-related protein